MKKKLRQSENRNALEEVFMIIINIVWSEAVMVNIVSLRLNVRIFTAKAPTTKEMVHLNQILSASQSYL